VAITGGADLERYEQVLAAAGALTHSATAAG